MKTVYYLQPSSFCFGVKRSIDQLNEVILHHTGEKIFCIHALVHNPKVTKEFESKGITFVESMDDIQDPKSIVVFSAHGINRETLHQAKQKFSTVYNLECPFVTKIYTQADNFIQQEITTFFYIGKKNHQEGKNILDYITFKGGTSYVFQTTEEIPNIDKNTTFAVLSQTTLNFDLVQNILEEIKKHYPNAILPAFSDVCKATCDRQTVVLQNIDKFKTYIVIGGKESNNTKELAEIGIKNSKQTFYGESLEDIIQYPQSELFAHENVAITGGASTPAEDIREVFEFYKNHGYTPKIIQLTTND